jgi:hypothetical protein
MIPSTARAKAGQALAGGNHAVALGVVSLALALAPPCMPAAANRYSRGGGHPRQRAAAVELHRLPKHVLRILGQIQLQVTGSRDREYGQRTPSTSSSIESMHESNSAPPEVRFQVARPSRITGTKSRKKPHRAEQAARFRA